MASNKDEKASKKAAPVAAAPEEPMIIVYVNDRLGTKAAIPCLASDPISKVLKFPILFRLEKLIYGLYRTLQSTSRCQDRARTS